MSSKSSSPVQAVLTFAALLMIPTFAVFGVPKFVPMSTSNETGESSTSQSTAIGLSDVYVEPAKFYPDNDEPIVRSNPSGSAIIPALDSNRRVESAALSNNPLLEWNDPFVQNEMQPAFSTTVSKPAVDATVAQFTWQKFDREIRLLGVTDYSLKPTSPGKFRLTCFVPSLQDKQLLRKFNAEAAEPIIAAQELLGDIQRWVKQ